MDTGAPVAAISLIDDATGLLLVAVRDPATNRTHPNVVSVPTQRIPAGTHRILVDAVDTDPTLDGRDHHDVAVYVTETVLCRKLGAAAALERGDLHFDVGDIVRLVGAADYGPDGTEAIDMINIVAHVTAGADHIPTSTVTYSTIRWIEPDDLADAVATKDPLIAISDGDPIDLCIHGLCVHSSVLAHRRGLLRTGPVAP